MNCAPWILLSDNSSLVIAGWPSCCLRAAIMAATPEWSHADAMLQRSQGATRDRSALAACCVLRATGQFPRPIMNFRHSWTDEIVRDYQFRGKADFQYTVPSIICERMSIEGVHWMISKSQRLGPSPGSVKMWFPKVRSGPSPLSVLYMGSRRE